MTANAMPLAIGLVPEDRPGRQCSRTWSRDIRAHVETTRHRPAMSAFITSCWRWMDNGRGDVLYDFIFTHGRSQLWESTRAGRHRAH